MVGFLFAAVAFATSCVLSQSALATTYADFALGNLTGEVVLPFDTGEGTASAFYIFTVPAEFNGGLPPPGNLLTDASVTVDNDLFQIVGGDVNVECFGCDFRAFWDVSGGDGVAFSQTNSEFYGQVNGVLTSYGDFGPPAFTTIAATPLPAAFPLFAGGLGVIGLIGGRRRRKKARAATA
jgi:hypothetical protein